jgi:Mor family transcriptional regulator
MTSKEALAELRNIIGDELYKAVIKELSGTMVYFPSNHEWQDKTERNFCLREDYYSGRFEISDLAQKYNISISRVYKIVESGR